MAIRKPLVNVNGEMRELPVSDFIGTTKVVTNFSDLPAANSVVAYLERYFVTGVGVGGSEWYSDGTRWRAVGEITLFQNGVPIVFAPSGTIANNGALTLTTALPMSPVTQYGVCWMYFPANAFQSGSAAGLYFVNMTSGTVGTVYQNQPTTSFGIPTSLVASTNVNSIAYSNTTYTDITFFSFTLKGGLLGNNGSLKIQGMNAISTSAGTKNFTTKINGGVAWVVYSTAAWFDYQFTMRNQGSQTRQVLTRANSSGVAGAGTNGTWSKQEFNLSADALFTFTANIPATTDFIIYESMMITMNNS